MKFLSFLSSDLGDQKFLRFHRLEGCKGAENYSCHGHGLGNFSLFRNILIKNLKYLLRHGRAHHEVMNGGYSNNIFMIETYQQKNFSST